MAEARNMMNSVFRLCHGRLLATIAIKGIYAMVATNGNKACIFIYGNYQAKRDNCQGVTKVGELT